MSDEQTIKGIDLASEGSTDDSKMSIGFGGRTVIEIDLKTGELVVDEKLKTTQLAQMFWQSIHEFVHPKQGVSIPLETPELQKLDVTLPNHGRVETGAVQFNEDWPGVFIRGDNAMWYGLNLQRLLDDPEAFQQDAIAKALLRGLANTLSSCQTG